MHTMEYFSWNTIKYTRYELSVVAFFWVIFILVPNGWTIVRMKPDFRCASGKKLLHIQRFTITVCLSHSFDRIVFLYIFDNEYCYAMNANKCNQWQCGKWNAHANAWQRSSFYCIIYYIQTSMAREVTIKMGDQGTK